MKQDHLVCFIGGSFLLGITEGGRKHINWKNLDDRDRLDYLAGTGIIDSCLESYNTATYVSRRLPRLKLFAERQAVFQWTWTRDSHVPPRSR